MQGRVKTLGIDLAKNVFQLHGVDCRGRKVLQRRVSRSRLLSEVGKLKPCLVGMEACGGAHYWAREMERLGHQVRIMAPQLVKPYRTRAKNDYNDAAAICEAVSRPEARFVAVKSTYHQDVQGLHREREQLVVLRTELCNFVRGLLAEYGEVLPLGRVKLKKLLPQLWEQSCKLTPHSMRLAQRVYRRLEWVEGELKQVEAELEEIRRTNPVCRRLETLPGVGKLTATAVVASVPDPNTFKNGREMAAWIGLVPRQNSSGQTQRLLSITRHGQRHLKTLLIHGGRSVVLSSQKRQDRLHRWAWEKRQSRGFNKATVAVANRNARHIWAVLKLGDKYKAMA